MNTAEAIEIYSSCYSDETYRMGSARFAASSGLIMDLPDFNSLLDVGCGRGEILQVAWDRGSSTNIGLEIVPDLIGGDVLEGTCTDIPFIDDCFEVVTCFDVLEHINPEETEKALKELDRVAGKFLILSAANYSSIHDGVELHINIKTYDEWDAIIREHCTGDVKRLGMLSSINSEYWVIQKCH